MTSLDRPVLWQSALHTQRASILTPLNCHRGEFRIRLYADHLCATRGESNLLAFEQLCYCLTFSNCELSRFGLHHKQYLWERPQRAGDEQSLAAMIAARAHCEADAKGRQGDAGAGGGFLSALGGGRGGGAVLPSIARICIKSGTAPYVSFF